jgi:hypothetical protein
LLIVLLPLLHQDGAAHACAWYKDFVPHVASCCCTAGSANTWQ